MFSVQTVMYVIRASVCARLETSHAIVGDGSAMQVLRDASSRGSRANSRVVVQLMHCIARELRALQAIACVLVHSYIREVLL